MYDADLNDANLEAAVVSGEQLTDTKDLTGATMPDGTEMTKELFDQLKNPAKR